MALGAQARDLLTMIFRRTMRPVVVGAIIGVVAAGALSRCSRLFGVSPVRIRSAPAPGTVRARPSLAAGVRRTGGD
jgi:hypothetical protein